ncbi:hypothetical protein D3C86_1946430 [compost metagenome]
MQLVALQMKNILHGELHRDAKIQLLRLLLVVRCLGGPPSRDALQSLGTNIEQEVSRIRKAYQSARHRSRSLIPNLVEDLPHSSGGAL